MELVIWKQGLAGFLLKGLIICVSFLGVFGVTYKLNQDYLRQTAEVATAAAARTDIFPGEPLTADKLILTEKPVFGLGEDYIADIDGFLATGPWYAGDLGIGAGDILRPGRLTAASGAGGDWRWEFDRREQARLIALETSLVRSSGDWLWPGTLVDALVYIPAKEGYDDPRPSQIIGPEEDPLLKDLLVIDIKTANGLSLGDLTTEDGYGRDKLPAVVTLMIDEHDLERIKALIRYNEEGKIYLSPASSRQVDE